MDNLETPYEEDDGFIECTVCEKSLRGDTLYKIHLTTPGHLKKEDSLVAEGTEFKPEIVGGCVQPNRTSTVYTVCTIIRLFKSDVKRSSFLFFTPSSSAASPAPNPSQSAHRKIVREHIMPKFRDFLHYLEYLNLDEPIIGLNFLEEVANFEPQLGPRYTCKLCNLTANLAEMVSHVIGRRHRQKYVELKRPDLVSWDSHTINTQGGKIMRAKAEIIERQNGRGVPEPLLRKADDGRLNTSRVPKHRPTRPPGIEPRAVPDVSPFIPKLQEHRQKGDLSGVYPDHLTRSCFDEERRGVNYMGVPSYKDDRIKPDYSTKYLPEYPKDPVKAAILDSRDAYGSSRTTVPRSLDYTPEASLKRPYPERDPLEEFYSEEVRRGQGYQPSPQMLFSEDNRRRSLDREIGRHDSMRRHGSSEPEAKRRTFGAPFEGDRSRESSLDVFQDYHHERKEPYQEEAFKRGRPTSAHGDVPRTMSNIPEPFRRFLKGSGDEEGQTRRRSRFSDATPEEVMMAKEMYRGDYEPPYTESGAGFRPVDAPMRSDMLYGKSLPPRVGDGYSQAGSEATSIFDLLKGVEIENAEEANFLKSKLASLLEEFKNKKKEKAVYDDHGQAGVSKNYGDLNRNQHLPQPYQYEKPLRQESDLRRSEELDFNNGRRLGWEQSDQIPMQQFHEYNHGESRHSSRGRFEDEKPQYAEPMRPLEYKPPSEKYFDPQSSVPPLQMEKGSRMHLEPRYSSNMDNITSALMDLVARK